MTYCYDLYLVSQLRFQSKESWNLNDAKLKYKNDEISLEKKKMVWTLQFVEMLSLARWPESKLYDVNATPTLYRWATAIYLVF